MNIIVRSSQGAYFVRPDTTWERDSEDFYPPESVTGLSFTPVLFAHICKPGRSISRKFAERYFDGVGFGILLYPENQLDGMPDSIARASCLDHTSFLPFPVTMPSGECHCLVSQNGTTIHECIFNEAESTGTDPVSTGDIISAISEASQYVYLRYGDIIALELTPIRPLMQRTDGEVRIVLERTGSPDASFRIIF